MSSILVKLGAFTLVSGLSVPAFAADPSVIVGDDQVSSVQDEVASFELAFADGANVNDDSRETSHDSAATARRAKVKEICAKVQATDEQKALIMDQVFSYKIAAAPLAATIRVAKLKYLQNVLAPAGTDSIATSSASEAITAVTSLLQAKEQMVTEILFSVLKQEQRKDGLMCMKAMKKARQHRRGH
jgi:hypothetical protein